MTRLERARFYTFLSLRSLLALLDLVGILAIGFLATSVALFLTEGSDSSRAIELGALSIPAVSAQSLPFISSLILILFIAKAILSILMTYQLAKFLARIEARAAREISVKAFGGGLQDARLNSREDILFAVQIGSPGAFNALLNSIGTLFAEGFLFVLVIAAFAIVNFPVALAALAYFGLIGFMIQFFIGGLMQRTSIKIADTTVEANLGISDLGDVLRETTILGRQNFFYDQIFQARVKASGHTAVQFVLSSMPRYVVETALIVAVAVFVLVQALSGEIASSAATLGIFLSGGLRLTASLLPLQSALLTVKKAIPSANRALDFLGPRNNKISEGTESSSIEKSAQPLSVTVENLSFQYHGGKGETILDISLEIPAGSQVAFIGTSGAGKSTIADLILGLLRPSKGTVRINAMDPMELLTGQPGLLGYVPQRPGMISGTIAQNIALGLKSEEIDRTRLMKAVQDSHLTDLISQLPAGLETYIGKRKDELSGGQLQRIGLARAFYSDPKLLVLDEATSALDAESENEINKILDEIRGQVTVILIAHRLNTIQRSDIVFLVEKGQITDRGTFQELASTNPTVQNLAQLMSIDSAD
jgi:ATP-binding cassette subfamily C protein